MFLSGMTYEQMMDELEEASPEFVDYFREALRDRIDETSRRCGFRDDKFAAGAEEIFRDRDVGLKMSVEHRGALVLAYEVAKSIWSDESTKDALQTR